MQVIRSDARKYVLVNYLLYFLIGTLDIPSIKEKLVTKNDFIKMII